MARDHQHGAGRFSELAPDIDERGLQPVAGSAELVLHVGPGTASVRQEIGGETGGGHSTSISSVRLNMGALRPRRRNHNGEAGSAVSHAAPTVRLSRPADPIFSPGPTVCSTWPQTHLPRTLIPSAPSTLSSQGVWSDADVMDPSFRG